MSSNPKVTVIIIFLNAGETFFKEAIESVFAQTYDDWELLLVDDGSTDISTEIARQYVSAYPDRVRYLEHKAHQNRGMSASRNLGIQQARGEYIAFLDADDLWLPQKLERQVKILVAHPDVAMVYSSTWMWHSWTGNRKDRQLDRGRNLGVLPDRTVSPPQLLNLFIKGEAETPGTCSVLIRKEAIRAVGGCEESFQGMFEDQALFAKICAQFPVFVASGNWDRYRQHSRSCCQIAQHQGSYDPLQPNRAHQHYLDWLERYLLDRSLKNTDTWRLLQAALDPYRRPQMSKLHPYRSNIAAVPAEVSRPLWSVMIPTYNCANYLRETLTSVLAQDPGADLMQIEVVDDCSTQDDPEAIVRELAGDRVSFYRQPQNVGYIKNFDTCLQRSRGELVHLLHGDDVVMPGFYRKLQAGFETHPDIGAAFSRHIFIDERSNWLGLSDLESPQSGILDNWLDRIAVRQRIQAPSIVVRREVYERLGGFDRRMKCWGEDWEMWVRIAVQYPVWYESEPLAQYRQSSKSLTGRSIRSGQNIEDFRQAIAIVGEYLPAEKSTKLSRRALKNCSDYALRTADHFITRRDRAAAIAQFRAAIDCHFSMATILLLMKLSLKAIYREIISTLNFYRTAQS